MGDNHCVRALGNGDLPSIVRAHSLSRSALATRRAFGILMADDLPAVGTKHLANRGGGRCALQHFRGITGEIQSSAPGLHLKSSHSIRELLKARATATLPPISLPASDSAPKPLHEVLQEEYELIQGKIDELGEFKFRVRGWSLTLQTAIIAAALSGKAFEAPSPKLYVCASIGALVIIGLFHMLEQEKEFFSAALSNRAVLIERALDGLTVVRVGHEERQKGILSATLRDLQSAPRIGATMRMAPRGIIQTFCVMFSSRIYFFYYVQYAVAIAAIVAALAFPIGSKGPLTTAGVRNAVEITKP